MQSSATTVTAYLESLPADRRPAIEAVRKVILENLDKNFEEGMTYGMIGFYVPHRVYPAGYHCDPKQPLPFMALASQKAHMSLYMSCLDMSTEEWSWFEKAWKAAGKKLDMGKCCIRFKRLDELALDVVGQVVARTKAKEYIQRYEAQRPAPKAKAKSKAPAKSKKAPKAN
jgi:hypothetical protein